MKERSKTAARSRREKENAEFVQLGKLLPLPSSITAHLDKASIIRLTTSYLKMRQLFPRGLGGEWGCENSSLEVGHCILKELSSHLLLSLDGFVFVLDPNAKIIYVSETASVHLGLSQVELTGNSIFDFIHNSDHEEMHSLMNYQGAATQFKHLDEAIEIPLSFCIRMKCVLAKRNAGLAADGFKAIHCSAYLKLRRTTSAPAEYQLPAGQAQDPRKQYQVVGLLAIGQSVPSSAITEIKMSSQTFMFRIGLDFTLLHSDARVTALTGYEPQKMVDKTLYQFVHASDCLQLQLDHRSLLLKGQVITKYYRLLTKNGGWIWIQSYCTVIHNIRSSKSHSIVAINHAISDREYSEDIMDTEQICDEIFHNKYKQRCNPILCPKQLQNIGISSDALRLEIPVPQDNINSLFRGSYNDGSKTRKKGFFSSKNIQEKLENKGIHQIASSTSEFVLNDAVINCDIIGSRALVIANRKFNNSGKKSSTWNEEQSFLNTNLLYPNNSVIVNNSSSHCYENPTTRNDSKHENYSSKALLERNDCPEFYNVCKVINNSTRKKELVLHENELLGNKAFQTATATTSHFKSIPKYLTPHTGFLQDEHFYLLKSGAEKCNLPQTVTSDECTKVAKAINISNHSTAHVGKDNNIYNRNSSDLHSLYSSHQTLNKFFGNKVESKIFKRSLIDQNNCAETKAKYSKANDLSLMKDGDLALAIDKRSESVLNSSGDILIQEENTITNETYNFAKSNMTYLEKSFVPLEKIDSWTSITKKANYMPVDEIAFPSTFNDHSITNNNVNIHSSTEIETSNILLQSICPEIKRLGNYENSGDNSNVMSNIRVESVYYSSEDCGSFYLNASNKNISVFNSFQSYPISPSAINAEYQESVTDSAEEICNGSKDCRLALNCDNSRLSNKPQSVGGESFSTASTPISTDVSTDNSSSVTVSADGDYQILNSDSQSRLSNLDVNSLDINGAQNIQSDLVTLGDASLSLNSTAFGDSFSSIDNLSCSTLFEDFPGTTPIPKNEYFPDITCNWLSNTPLVSNTAADINLNSNASYPQQNILFNDSALVNAHPSISLLPFKIQNC